MDDGLTMNSKFVDMDRWLYKTPVTRSDKERPAETPKEFNTMYRLASIKLLSHYFMVAAPDTW
jgi:hypothetical protein